MRDSYSQEPNISREHYGGFEVSQLRKSTCWIPVKLDLPPGFKPYIVAGIVGVREVEPSPAARARADEIIAAWEQYRAEWPEDA